MSLGSPAVFVELDLQTKRVIIGISQNELMTPDLKKKRIKISEIFLHQDGDFQKQKFYRGPQD